MGGSDGDAADPAAPGCGSSGLWRRCGEGLSSFGGGFLPGGRHEHLQLLAGPSTNQELGLERNGFRLPSHEEKLRGERPAAAAMEVNPLEGLRRVAVNRQLECSSAAEAPRQQPGAAAAQTLDSAAQQGTSSSTRSGQGPRKWVSSGSCFPRCHVEE